MKKIEWNENKNLLLKKTRGVSFEEVRELIIAQDILDITPHPSPKYQHQRIFVLRINGYIHIVPFVEDDEKIFLKTIIPSGKYNKKFNS